MQTSLGLPSSLLSRRRIPCTTGDRLCGSALHPNSICPVRCRVQAGIGCARLELSAASPKMPNHQKIGHSRGWVARAPKSCGRTTDLDIFFFPDVYTSRSADEAERGSNTHAVRVQYVTTMAAYTLPFCLEWQLMICVGTAGPFLDLCCRASTARGSGEVGSWLCSTERQSAILTPRSLG